MSAEIDTKEKILNISLNLFATKGFDCVGVQEIAVACNITKPTLYYYFKSKNGLLESILTSKGEILIEAVKNAANFNGDFVKNLTDVLKTHLNYAKQNKDFFALTNYLMIAPRQSDCYALFLPYKTNLESIYEKLFFDAVAVFGNMKGFEKFYAKGFFSDVNNFCTCVLNGELQGDEETINKVVKSFVYGAAN